MITTFFGYIGKSHNNHQNEKIGFEACTQKASISCFTLNNKLYAFTLTDWNKMLSLVLDLWEGSPTTSMI